jgi:hypothetical protein
MRARRSLLRLAPTVAVAAAVAVVGAFAVQASGQRVQRVEANNAGLWASSDGASDEPGSYGRFNKAASSLEFATRTSTTGTVVTTDVVQDGDVAVARDLSHGMAYAIDPRTGTHAPEAGIALASGYQLDLRGGTLAVFDPTTGKLWASRVDTSGGPVALGPVDPATAAAVAELGPVPGGGVPGERAALSVGEDGSVHAATASGRTVSIAVAGGSLAGPTFAQLPELGTVRIAAVGSQAAVLDATAGTLYLPGGGTASVGADPQAELQQGGSETGTVTVATSTRLLRVGYDGAVTELFTGVSGKPARPVSLGTTVTSCQVGAWAGSHGTVVRSCDGAPGESLALDAMAGDFSLQDPAFRVNWGLVVLNDRATGRIFDLELLRSFDYFKDLLREEEDAENEDEQTTVQTLKAKPVAKPDEYWARPGATSILHVLDNDSDPNGQVLAITNVDEPSGGGRVRISSDGQTLQFTQPESGGGASFGYTITNEGGEATGTVTIQPAAANHPPALRENYEPPTYSVSSSGSLTIPVATDWRDPDGDPIVVTDPEVEQDPDALVLVASDGQLEFTASRTEARSTRMLRYSVTDGTDAAADTGSVQVAVLGEQDQDGIAPVANADATRGEVGKPITVSPLANDIPGVDPGVLETRLELDGDVTGWEGDREVDTETGLVTLTTSEEGTYLLNYQATFGTAGTATGTIRVDVVKGLDTDPVATPDEAVVRGRQPITVDVLANDYDPTGGMLTVQTATSTREADLQVAVVKSRWLRIIPMAEDFSQNPAVVTYQITNGTSGLVTGSVAVTQLPALDEDTPLTRPDAATVRAGDSVLIPVLANDLTLGGASLTLDPNAAGAPAPGQFEVLGEAGDSGQDPAVVGRAYLSGGQVRFVAPATVTEPTTVGIRYFALAGDVRAEGLATVTVNPAPTAENPDTPPEPQLIELRATSGDTTTIAIPASGQDPDGDSVTLVGLASGPTLGRVTGMSAKGISYQVFPNDDNVGTDTFTYTVVDAFGQQGTGTIRVAVVPPGQTQPPVAVDDIVTARPGARVHLDVLANDLIAQSDKVIVKPLDGPPEGVSLDGEQGPITATAPAADAEPLQFTYQLRGNGGDSTTGQVQVVAREGFLNPPQVRDQLAVPGPDGKTASVDVLANAWDPDSDTAALSVGPLTAPGATVVGGLVTVPVLDRPQVLSYEVTDGDGATAAALLYVPASGDGVPYSKGRIELQPSSTTAVGLAEHVVSPRGTPVSIYLESGVTVEPSQHLSVKVSDDHTVQLTTDDYTGPAVLNVDVTDRESADDPDARRALVSIPIQVGPSTPVLHCPEEPQTVKLGTVGKTLDLVSLCHVWTETEAELPALTFAVAWEEGKDPGRVTPQLQGQTLTLVASGEADASATGSLRVELPGTSAVADTLGVKLKKSPPPTYSPPVKSIEVQQGFSQEGTVAIESEIEVDKAVTIVSAEPLDGAETHATFTPTGDHWKIETNADFDGVLRYRLTVSDIANSVDDSRRATGILRFSVYGEPDAPEAPREAGLAPSHAANLTFHKPDNNGATILEYEISSDLGKGPWKCTALPCHVDGLDNATPIRFTVKARNKAGWSEDSLPSKPVIPDTVPTTVTGFTMVGKPSDGTVSLQWNAVSGDFSNVTGYLIKGAGKKWQVSGTSTTVHGLPNLTKGVPLTIVAKNDRGYSRRPARTTGWPTGKPGAFSITDLNSKMDLDKPLVHVKWSKAASNGRGPITYTVTEGGKEFCAGTKKASCDIHDYGWDGETHKFTVTAKNYYDYATSVSDDWTAIGTPDTPAAPIVKATGDDNKVSIEWATKQARGPEPTVEILKGGSSVKGPFRVDSDGESKTETIDAPNGQPARYRVKLCAVQGKCETSEQSDEVTPYGPIKGLSSGKAAEPDGQTVYLHITVNANGRPLRVLINGNHWKTTGVGTFDDTYSVDLGGYDVERDFEVTVEDGSRSQSAPKVTLRSASPPKSVSISKSDVTVAGCSYYGGGNCPYINVDTRGFSGKYQCEFFRTDQGGPWFSAFTYDGDRSGRTGAYFGYKATVYVTCGGVRSNNVNW